MRRVVYSLIFTAFLIPGYLNAQEAQKISLEDAINLAMKNNLAVKDARLDVLKQQYLNKQITGTAYPQLSGKGEFTQYADQLKSFVPGEFLGQPGTFVAVPFTPKYSSTASLSASQILFDGTVLVALQARNTIIQLMQQKEALTLENVKYNTRLAYYSLVISQKQFEITKKTLANTRKLANDIDIQYQTGVAEKIASDRFRLIVNNSAADSVRSQNLITLSEQLLKYQMGLPLEQPIVLTDTSIEDNLNDINQLLLNSLDVANRTEFTMLQTQLKLNQYDVKRYKYAAYPTLSAFGGAGYNIGTEDFKGIFKDQYPFNSFFGLTLSVPIFKGFQRTYQVKQALVEVQRTKDKIDDLRLGINLSYTQARTQLNNAMIYLKSQNENLALANTVMDLATRKYNEGVGSTQEIVDAQNTFLQTQANYFLALMDVINSRTNLEKQLGINK